MDQDARKVRKIHRRGTRAEQPVATDVINGTIYFVTDELITERSTGAAWESYSSAAYSTEIAQDAIGTILTDTTTVDLVYDDGVPSISATVIDDSITLAKFQEIATASVLGRNTAGNGNPEVLTTLPLGVQDNITKLGSIAEALQVENNVILTAATFDARQVRTGDDTHTLTLAGGTTYTAGASIQFYGEDHATLPGDIYFVSGGSSASPASSIIELAYRDSGGYKGRWTMNTAGKFGIASGYSNGGTVTQNTSKTTGVTLSKITGEITTHNSALDPSLGAGFEIASFVLTNTLIAAGDYVMVQHVSGGTAGAYTVSAVAAAGSATITLRNATSASLSEAVVIKFFVLKAVTS